jgi:molybdopterin-containing oxidoreductase family iron-sulfur binding subunit
MLQLLQLGLKLDNVPVIVQPGQARYYWIGFRLRSYSGFERRQVGLNAYALYKGFNDVQSVTLVKADTDDEFVCSGSKNING